MKLLYLSYFSAPKTFEAICGAGLEPSVARQNYDTALIDNMFAHENLFNDIDIISYLPYNDQLGDVVEEEEYLGKNISYVWTKRNNVRSIFNALKRVKTLVKEWIKKTEGEHRIILTYAANPILLHSIAGMISRKKIKIATICSEIPKYRNMTEGNKILNALKKKIFTHYNKKMDGYIYMSKHMNDVCNLKGVPWIVVEGMTDIQPLETILNKSIEKVFYAGGLHIENGIDVLLDAIVKINQQRKDKVILQLCGVGNAVSLIEEYENKYDFVKYLGSLPNNEVRALEKNATLLINPRKPDLLLTRYSFPSKTFEYFSSGTASILTRLEGIPSEFYKYCFVCNVDNSDVLAEDIKQALDVPLNERRELALRAYQFLIEEKSATVQTQKIVQFLKSL